MSEPASESVDEAPEPRAPEPTIHFWPVVPTGAYDEVVVTARDAQQKPRTRRWRCRRGECTVTGKAAGEWAALEALQRHAEDCDGTARQARKGGARGKPRDGGPGG